MCHAWITHWTVARAILTMSRRRSTCDERTHGRDAPNLSWHAREPVWRLERPFLNRAARDERANRRTEHGEQPIYQIKRSRHLQVILHMDIKFWVVRTRSHQLPG